jgi:DNA-binding IclR family transcriptional regulator
MAHYVELRPESHRKVSRWKKASEALGEPDMAAPKVLAILQLFTVESPRWRVERIAAELGVSTSTAYRCVAELVRTGFLQPVSGGAYVLGPAFIEFDRRMRLSDPMLRAAVPYMRELQAQFGPVSTASLARSYRDCVMYVHIERGREAAAGHVRGQRIPLFSSAAMARAVLFALPDRVLRGLHQRHAAEISAAGLGDTARDFRALIKAQRERGWTFARSVIDAGVVSVAAPVVCSGIVRGSLGVSLPEPLGERDIERAGRLVMLEAGRIASQLARDAPDAPRLLGRRAANLTAQPTLQ